MRIVDTHLHLEAEEFSEDLEEVVGRAEACGVHMITSAITPHDWQRGIEIARRFGNVDVSLGLDPVLCDSVGAAISWIGKHGADIVSIGEAGLDFYRERDHARRDAQEAAFKALIALADDLRIPIQVHSRSAGRVALGVLEKAEAGLVHMHAFDGKAGLACEASRNLGYYFSIPTSVVRSPQKQKLVKAVDIEHILVETDSPVLAPVRGERNEPANVWTAVEQIAAILHRTREEVRSIILENTLRLYTGLAG